MSVIALEFVSAMRINKGDSFLVEILGKHSISVFHNLLTGFNFRGDNFKVSNFVMFAMIAIDGIHRQEDFVEVNKSVCEDVVPDSIRNRWAVRMADEKMLDIDKVAKIVFFEEECYFKIRHF